MNVWCSILFKLSNFATKFFFRRSWISTLISSTCILPIPNIAMTEFVYKCRNILINKLSVVIAWHVFGRIYCRTKLLSVHGLFDLQTNNCNLLNVTVCSAITIISAADTFINIIFCHFSHMFQTSWLQIK